MTPADLKLGIISGRRVGAEDGRVWADAGYGRVLEELARRFDDIVVASPPAGRTDERNISVHLDPEQILPMPELGSIASGTLHTREVSRVVREIDGWADVVLVQLAFQAPLALLGLRSPLVYHVVGDPLGVALDSTVYAGIRRVPAVASAGALEVLHRVLIRRPGAGLVTNGEALRRTLAPGKGRSVVSSSLWDREIDSVGRSRPADAPPRVLYAGYLRGWKGLDTLMEAYELLLDLEPRAEVVVAGPGSLDDVVDGTLLERVRRRGTVIARGTVPFGPDLFEEYANADVLALPSRRGEGTPRVLVEARAFRCPVVATAVGGVPSSVTHGVDGLLVDPDEPVELARALHHVLTDRQDRERLVAAGLARAHRSTVEAFVDAITAEAVDAFERNRRDL